MKFNFSARLVPLRDGINGIRGGKRERKRKLLLLLEEEEEEADCLYYNAVDFLFLNEEGEEERASGLI